MLSKAGYLADIAQNGREAVDKAGSGDYGLILMDVQMPLLDGLAATREIRASETGRSLPIIAMTAEAYPEDRRRCLEAGMDDYLAKPIEAELLFAAIERVLGRGA